MRGLVSLGSAGDLAGDVAVEAAEPGAHAPDQALGLAVAAAVDQPGHLALGTGGDAPVGLAQPDAVKAQPTDSFRAPRPDTPPLSPGHSAPRYAALRLDPGALPEIETGAADAALFPSAQL